jgi:hypothetical protein
MSVRLDLNNPEFQDRWFSLEKPERLAVLEACVKLASMDWNQIYQDKGLRWEMIRSRKARDGTKLYSIRITRKVRAVVKRSGDFPEFITLHPDHDFAYQ